MAGLIKEPLNTVRRKEKSCPLSPRPSGPKPDCREAAPLAPETVRQLFDLTGKRIYDVYGLTENTASPCTKVPRQIAFLNAQPKSAVGKILRRELRALDAKS